MRLKKILKIIFVSYISAKAIAFSSPKKNVPSWVYTIDGLLKSPNIKAFLDMLSYAEGTFNKKNGYQMIGSRDIFDDFRDHPRLKVSSTINNKILKSTAAGRYQILEKTWDSLANKMHLQDFSPQNQDKMALALIRDMGALRAVQEGRFEEAVNKLGIVWASLPSSNHGQKVIPMQELKQFYLKRLEYYKKNK